MGIEVGLRGGGGARESSEGSTNFTGSWIEQYRAADMTFFFALGSWTGCNSWPQKLLKIVPANAPKERVEVTRVT